MFSLVGRVVIYGFCLYGMVRMFEDAQTPGTKEGSFVKPQQSEEHLGMEGASRA